MTKPIRPDEIVAREFPSEVYEAFNELIAAKFRNDGSAVIEQADVVNLLRDKGFTRSRIFDENLLDVEDAYRAVGWDVEYEKPGYNEPGVATFTFTRRVKS